MLLETSLTILHPKACEALFNRSKVSESYDKDNELCAGKQEPETNTNQF